jgi:hypothetical protein
MGASRPPQQLLGARHIPGLSLHAGYPLRQGRGYRQTHHGQVAQVLADLTPPL